MEDAFSRRPRPQVPYLPVPTKAALLKRARYDAEPPIPIVPIVPPRPSTLDVEVDVLRRRTPWAELTRLGRLVQGSTQWTICARREPSVRMLMFKKVPTTMALAEKEMLGLLSHPNIASLQEVLTQDDCLLLGFEYTRFTLEELIHVHLPLEELHLRYIAKSIFDAVSYISGAGFVHGRIRLDSIRICGRTSRIFLTNFDGAIAYDPGMLPNTDLQDMGFLLLECMDRRPRPDLKEITFIQRQRALNKVFGLNKPERWSGCKQLIDFLDDLFNQEKTAHLKLQKPHHFVDTSVKIQECLVDMLELVTLECFTLWHIAHLEGEAES